MDIGMTQAEMEFEFLVTNVRDAIIEWEEPEIECPLLALFRANEEAKMRYLQTMVKFFEGN